MGRLTTEVGPLPSDRGAKYSSAEIVGMGTVLSAGVDFLTCTASTLARIEMLKAAGWSVVMDEATAGNDLRPWTWKGYDGITSGSASCGVRSDGCLVRISGGLAAETWKKAATWADHVSRLDLAVTVRMHPAANPALEAFTVREHESGRERGRPVQRATHITTWTEGETTYLGGRQSDRYGRLYNKGLETKEEVYLNAWRWEVEYKGRASSPIASVVQDSGNESEAVLAIVWDQFRKWGVPPSWGRGAEVGNLVPPRQPTNDDRRIAWLATQVRPVLDHLAKMGRREDMMRALGLSPEEPE